MSLLSKTEDKVEVNVTYLAVHREAPQSLVVVVGGRQVRREGVAKHWRSLKKVHKTLMLLKEDVAYLCVGKVSRTLICCGFVD